MVDIPDRKLPTEYRSKRIDQYRSFFKPTLADNQDEFYAPRRPLIGIELSTANLEREERGSFVHAIICIQEMLINGQDAVALEDSTTMTAELELSRSDGGLVLDHIFSNRIEYSQTQNVHEYQHQPERRGFFGGRKNIIPPEGG